MARRFQVVFWTPYFWSCLFLRVDKSFEITYVRLKFHSSRPESFAIYKRTTERSTWQPWQFYSSSCQETYRLPVRPLIHRDNEAQAICRDDFSDISPLTGASVAFSTLEGRPSAYNFENSAVLQVRIDLSLYSYWCGLLLLWFCCKTGPRQR